MSINLDQQNQLKAGEVSLSRHTRLNRLAGIFNSIALVLFFLLLLLSASFRVHAGTVLELTPLGVSGSTYSGASSAISGSSVGTSASASVGGKLLKFPVTAPISGSGMAGRLAGAVYRSAGNPWLFGAGLAAGLIYDYLKDQGVEPGPDGTFGKVGDFPHCSTGECRITKVDDNYFYIVNSGKPGFDLSAAIASLGGTSYTHNGTFTNCSSNMSIPGCTADIPKYPTPCPDGIPYNQCNDAYRPSYIFVIVNGGASVPAPIPTPFASEPVFSPPTSEQLPGLAGELLGAGQPIDLEPLSWPASVPISSKSATTVDAQGNTTVKTTESQLQITPRPELSPTTIEATETTTETTTANGNPVETTTTTNPEPEINPNPSASTQNQTDCQLNPALPGCQELTAPDAVALPNQVIPLTFSAVNFNVSGVCPAPPALTFMGVALPFTYDPICDFASMIRPVVLSIAWLSAAYMFIGAARKQ